MPKQCGDRLTGLYQDVTLLCSLDAGHHGRHEDPQLGPVIEWTNNSYRMLKVVA